MKKNRNEKKCGSNLLFAAVLISNIILGCNPVKADTTDYTVNNYNELKSAILQKTSPNVSNISLNNDITIFQMH